MAHALKISLLGTLSITIDGVPLDVESNYGRALLLYLVLEKDHPLRREALAEMLWPGRPDRVARNSLKQALSNLRRMLRDRDRSNCYLLGTRHEIQFNQSSHYWCDAEEFIDLIEDCEQHAHDNLLTCSACETKLLRCMSLYQGDFLSGFYLPDNRDFNDWVILNQEAFHRRISTVLIKLAQIYEGRGDYANASACCRQLANLEPWNEENHRNLMRLLALSGKRSAALRQFQICCENLKLELGVEPTNATILLREQIESWEEETSLDASLLTIPVVNNKPTISPEKITTDRHPIFRILIQQSILAIVIVCIFFEISSLFFVGVSRFRASAFESTNGEVIQSTVPATAKFITPTMQQPTLALTGNISEPELSALVTLYDQAGGPDWENSDGWSTGRSPCQWFGIVCRQNKIVELNLNNNRLSGTLPEEIGQLKDLELLDLGDNELHGSIPSGIGGLVNLRRLTLWGNRELSGPIPPEIGNLVNLEHLELAHWESGGSLLEGAIPTEIGNLKKLRSLSISVSLLSGPIPVEIYALANLEDLYLDSNRLIGPIHPEIGNLLNLQALDLGGNDFVGSLPAELGNLPMLDYLAVGGSLVSGEVPAELGNSVRLRHLVLDHTGLSGPLPLSLMNLNLRELTFFGTEVCEPPDEAFQTWLEGIPEIKSNGVVCEREGG